MDLIKFYKMTEKFVINHGYVLEVTYVKDRYFKDQTAMDFRNEFAYVVLNAGMKNQVAERMYRRWLIEGSDTLNHEGKRTAIKQAERYYMDWFIQLQGCKDLEAQLEYLETLPWIGPITKYHLARNLGIDVSKPDRHLTKLAKLFNYPDVQNMCKFISEQTGERVGVVDVILWRYCNLTGIDIDDPMFKAYIKPDDWGKGTENLSSEISDNG